MIRWVGDLRMVGHVPSEAASAALTEFGGLRVVQRGPGITMARESFELDPMLGLAEFDRLRTYGFHIGRDLFPLGECENGAYLLAISGDGRVFVVGDFVMEIGRDIREALNNLIEGRRGTTFDRRG